jgi:hypothetical protein
VTIKDNLELHSHYIEQLFESNKIIRERTHEMKQEIAIQTHVLSQHDKDLLRLVENAKSTSEEIRKLKSENEKQKSMFQFIKDLFEKPINWVYVSLLLILIESIKGIEIQEIVKHFVEKIF